MGEEPSALAAADLNYKKKTKRKKRAIDNFARVSIWSSKQRTLGQLEVAVSCDAVDSRASLLYVRESESERVVSSFYDDPTKDCLLFLLLVLSCLMDVDADFPRETKASKNHEEINRIGSIFLSANSFGPIKTHRT